MPWEVEEKDPFPTEEATPYDEMSAGELSAEAIKNIPSSAMNMAKDIYGAIADIPNTAKAVANLGMGVAEKVIPGEQGHEKYADAMVDYFMERYGENWEETLATDPIGVVADVATVFTGAGAAVRGVGVAGKVAGVQKAAGVAQKVGKTVQKIGEGMEPLNVAAKTGVLGLKAVPKFIPERLYERAAKIPPAKFSNPKDRIKAVRTALDEGIMPTQKGVDLLWEKISGIEDSVDSVIKSGKGKTVETGDIARTLDEVRKDFANDPFADKFLSKIDDYEVQFTQKGKTVSVEDAQKIKKRAYKTLRKAYEKELTSVGEDTRMAVARGIREEMELLFPELKELGKREGSLLELNKAIKQAVGRIDNHNMFSLSALIAGGGIGSATQSPMATVGTVALVQVLGHPKVQANLAINLRKAKKANLATVGVKGVKIPTTNIRVGGAKARLAAEQAVNVDPLGIME